LGKAFRLAVDAKDASTSIPVIWNFLTGGAWSCPPKRPSMPRDAGIAAADESQFEHSRREAGHA